MVESEEAKELARNTQKTAQKAIDVTGRYLTEVVESENTKANLRKVQAELEKAETAGLNLISKQAMAALDSAAIPAATKADIKAKYTAAAEAAQVAQVEVEQALKMAEEAFESKEAQAARRAGAKCFACCLTLAQSSGLRP